MFYLRQFFKDAWEGIAAMPTGGIADFYMRPYREIISSLAALWAVLMTFFITVGIVAERMQGEIPSDWGVFLLTWAFPGFAVWILSSVGHELLDRSQARNARDRLQREAIQARMADGEPVSIELSKTVLSIVAAGTGGFVLVGLVFIFGAAGLSNEPTAALVLFAVGVASVTFFGMGARRVRKALWSESPGLVIGPEGLTCNIMSTWEGLIPWADIEKVEPVGRGTGVLVFDLEKYKPVTGRLKKYSFDYNVANFGTPIVVFPDTLKIRSDLLQFSIAEGFRQFGRNVEPERTVQDN